MQTLDVFKKRRSTVVKVGDRDFKIPSEYTAEEVERLLELEIKQEKIEKEQVSDDSNLKAEQLQRFYKTIFDRLEIMLQHFQPEITADELRNLITHTEALDILGWFEQHRDFQSDDTSDSKKKLN